MGFKNFPFGFPLLGSIVTLASLKSHGLSLRPFHADNVGYSPALFVACGPTLSSKYLFPLVSLPVPRTGAHLNFLAALTQQLSMYPLRLHQVQLLQVLLCLRVVIA